MTGCSVMQALLLLVWLQVVSCFPEYDDPRSLDPALRRPDGKKCVVHVFNNATSSYFELAQSLYSPPVQCLGSWASSLEPEVTVQPLSKPVWSKVVIDWTASIAGLQFDRVGALWIGDIEVLRTTTPEPEKDITEYSSYLLNPNNITLSVLNIVTSKYTGVIYVNLTLTFYEPTQEFPAFTAAPAILPFFSNPIAGGDPFSVLIANKTKSTVIRTPEGSHYNRVYLDVYASGHGSDEFWYTNIPEPYAKKLGVPGGGSYREIQVFFDNLFAGSVYPFPAIYTGGVNPLLWRPLTGILSFDIPSYRFDLTPFVGSFNDGRQHNVTIVLFDDNDQGFWYLDGVFVLYSDYPGAIVGGHLIELNDGQPQVNVKIYSKTTGFLSFYTTGSHLYTISGLVTSKYGNNTVVSNVVTVSGNLASENFNTISLDGSVQDTQGSLETVIATEAKEAQTGGLRRISRFNYPFDVRQEGTQANNLLQIKARVLYSREREEKWIPNDGEFFQIAWKNTIGSTAFYNRSVSVDMIEEDFSEKRLKSPFRILRPSEVIYNQTNDSVETFFITSPITGLCYNREAHAVDGTILSNTGEYKCAFSGGLDFCGSELCAYQYLF